MCSALVDVWLHFRETRHKPKWPAEDLLLISSNTKRYNYSITHPSKLSLLKSLFSFQLSVFRREKTCSHRFSDKRHTFMDVRYDDGVENDRSHIAHIDGQSRPCDGFYFWPMNNLITQKLNKSARTKNKQTLSPFR